MNPNKKVFPCCYLSAPLECHLPERRGFCLAVSSTSVPQWVLTEWQGLQSTAAAAVFLPSLPLQSFLVFPLISLLPHQQNNLNKIPLALESRSFMFTSPPPYSPTQPLKHKHFYTYRPLPLVSSNATIHRESQGFAKKIKIKSICLLKTEKGNIKPDHLKRLFSALGF